MSHTKRTHDAHKFQRMNRYNAQTRANLFNVRVPVGSLVDVTDDVGAVVQTRTRSAAWVLGGHSAVVLLADRAGGYALDRVKKV